MCGMCTNAEKVLEKEGEKSSPHGIGRSTNSLGLDTSGTSSLVFLRLSHTRLRRWVGVPSFTSSDSPGEMEASPLSGQPGLAGRLLLPRLRNILVPQVCPSPQWEHMRAGLAQASCFTTIRVLPRLLGKPHSWAESGLASQDPELGEGVSAWKCLVPVGTSSLGLAGPALHLVSVQTRLLYSLMVGMGQPQWPSLPFSSFSSFSFQVTQGLR